MSVLITANQLTHSFGVKTLFKNLSFSIHAKEKVGLIGPNGSGKTTLLKILTDRIHPDEGQVTQTNSVSLGLLEQTPLLDNQISIFQAIHKMVRSPEDWEKEVQARKTISQMGLDVFPESQLLGELSGGWKKRVALAQVLVNNPSLLILDEPTNHLDIEGVLWLEDFLKKTTLSVLMITHDRLFLERTCSRIIELNPCYPEGIFSVEGNYSTYLQVREEFLRNQKSQEDRLANTLRRETEWLKQGAKARTTKQQARIKNAADLASEVQDLRQRNQSRNTQIEFQASTKSPKKLIDAHQISKSFGDKVLFSNFDLRIFYGSRIGLIGKNGSGKSTLIRCIIGKEPVTSGTIKRADQLSAVYFDQQKETLDSDITVAQTLCPDGDSVIYLGKSVHIQSYLRRFLFSSNQATMPVNKLSGGERSRLLIAKLMLQPANLLILDEPTNDLDLETLNVLEDCLQEFPGAVILISHDRYFLDQVSDSLISFPEESSGSLLTYASYNQWETAQREIKKKAFENQRENREEKSKKPKNSKKGLSYKENKEFETMEETILALESELETLSEQSHRGEFATNPIKLQTITEEMATLEQKIETLYARWSELESKKNNN